MQIETKKDNLIGIFTISDEYPAWVCSDPVIAPERAILKLDFDPIKAVSYGILGSNIPTVTRSGIEVLACCHALNGWG